MPLPDLHDRTPPARDRQSSRGPAVPPAPIGPGLGLSLGRRRPCPAPPTRPTYSRRFTLDLAVANAATEQIGSGLLSQPFRVDTFAVNTGAAAGADVDASLAYGQDIVTAGSTGDATRRPIDQTASETATGQLTRADPNNQPVAAGTILRNVPGNFVLTVRNNSGGALRVTATVAVTFLEDLPVCEDAPHDAY
jgi:hypothetical protein